MAATELKGRWSFLREFHPPPTIGGEAWHSLQPFVELANDFAATTAREVQTVLEEWDNRLAELNGDALRETWADFRPLRLSREEDWADWLAHLLQTSEKGHFAASLFKRSPVAGVTARREVVAWGNADHDRRLDLVITWGTDDRTNLEIKIGDQNFAKTREAAHFIEGQHPGAWQHALLVPPEDEDNAIDDVASDDDPLAIYVLTWRDVALALRGCLWNACGTISWRVVARMFLGAIEQRLLYIRPIPRSASRIASPAAVLALIAEGRHERHV